MLALGSLSFLEIQTASSYFLLVGVSYSEGSQSPFVAQHFALSKRFRCTRQMFSFYFIFDWASRSALCIFGLVGLMAGSLGRDIWSHLARSCSILDLDYLSLQKLMNACSNSRSHLDILGRSTVFEFGRSHLESFLIQMKMVWVPATIDHFHRSPLRCSLPDDLHNYLHLPGPL